MANQIRSHTLFSILVEKFSCYTYGILQVLKKLVFLYILTINLLLLLTDSFRALGAWRKTMEPQKPGNSPGLGPEVVERRRVAKERAVQRVRSWAVQNEMRGVLEQMSTSTA